jgi:hypothetical protein
LAMLLYPTFCSHSICFYIWYGIVWAVFSWAWNHCGEKLRILIKESFFAFFHFCFVWFATGSVRKIILCYCWRFDSFRVQLYLV